MSAQISVLLVEDDILDVEMVERILRSAHPPIFRLSHVATFRDAVNRVGEARFHVVLLDLALPDNTGLSGLARLTSEIPDIPIIVLTGLDDVDTDLKAIELGAQEFLIKSELTPVLLIRAIRHAAKRKHVELKKLGGELDHDDQGKWARLAEIIKETADVVCSRTSKLKKTELTQEQRTLVTEIDERSRDSLEFASKHFPKSVDPSTEDKGDGEDEIFVEIP